MAFRPRPPSFSHTNARAHTEKESNQALNALKIQIPIANGLRTVTKTVHRNIRDRYVAVIVDYHYKDSHTQISVNSRIEKHREIQRSLSHV
jgi:hypothetical protein